MRVTKKSIAAPKTGQKGLVTDNPTRNHPILDNVPQLSYTHKNLIGDNPWEKHPPSELELNPI